MVSVSRQLLPPILCACVLAEGTKRVLVFAMTARWGFDSEATEQSGRPASVGETSRECERGLGDRDKPNKVCMCGFVLLRLHSLLPRACRQKERSDVD